MSAIKYLLRALDESWVLEDAELMQLIADAIDRIEQIDGQSETTEKRSIDRPRGIGNAVVQKTGAPSSDSVQEVTTQVIELYDPEFAAVYDKWNNSENLRLLMEASEDLGPESIRELIKFANSLSTNTQPKTGSS